MGLDIVAGLSAHLDSVSFLKIRSSPVRCLKFAAIAAFLSISELATAGPKVRVRGTAQVRALVEALADRLEARGTVLDDAGQPVPNASVALRVVDGQAARRFRAWDACDARARTVREEGPEREELVVLAGVDGQFCAAFDSKLEGSIEFRALGSDWLLGSAQTVSIDRTRRSLQMNLDSFSDTLLLDRRSHLLHVDANVLPAYQSDDTVHEIKLRLELHEGGVTRTLSDIKTRPNERTEIEVRSADLGAPGEKELVISFAGSSWLTPGQATRRIQVVSPVSLNVSPTAHATAGQPFRQRVQVTSRNGAVMSGSVELQVEGSVVGIFPVAHGQATPSALLRARAEGPSRLQYAFIPATPYLVPDHPVKQSVTVDAEPGPSSLLWIFGVVIAAAWILTAWWRPRGSTHKLSSMQTAAGQVPGPGLELVRALLPQEGWTGRVLDAHTGQALQNVSITLSAPSFAGTGVLETTITDAEGAFHLAPVPSSTGGVAIALHAPLHLPFAQQLPTNGELIVRMVSRRRALLDGLILWAQRRGRPWNRPGDPTPGYVARIADRHLAPEVTAWAESVEAAAFGADPVDEPTERAVQTREPRS